MHRRTLILVVVLGIMALSTRFLVNREIPGDSQTPPDPEIRFVEYDATPPLSTPQSPMSEFQSTLDSVSGAALSGNWNAASNSVHKLNDLWQRLKPQQTSNLQTEKEIDEALLNITNSVWGKDEQGVLASAQKLTVLINRLTG